MTSLVYSIFSSASSQIANRVEQLRSAEASLVEYARRTYSHKNHDYHLELVDTRIPRSAIPIKDKSSGCQVFPSTNDDDDDDNDLIIHGLKVEDRTLSSTNKSQPPLVLLHGYANGSLYFYRNLVGLSETQFPTIHALDMLGWGLSSRPKFDTTPDNTSVESAEAFFVESLEAWRKQNQIEKMMLAGHSMGGYMSVAYAEKYPERVERLILLSPVGVPESKLDDLVDYVESLPFKRRMMMKSIGYMFNMGITPQGFLRKLSESRSKQMVESYVERRLPTITCPDERRSLSNYLYLNAMLPASGESCLSRILTPGAFAKKPLLHRIPQLNVKSIHFLYGQNDWMDATGGLDVQKLCHEKRKEGLDSPDVNVYGVKNAGHLLMLESHEEFNAALVVAGGGKHRLSPDAPIPKEFDHLNDDHERFFRDVGFKARANEAKQQQQQQQQKPERGGDTTEPAQTPQHA